MSKCISVHGEYSEHEYTTKPVCDHCGQISEMLAIAQNEAMRTALEQIKEMHAKTFVTAADEVWELNARCTECHDAHPCATYQHAEQGLAGGDRG